MLLKLQALHIHSINVSTFLGHAKVTRQTHDKLDEL